MYGTYIHGIFDGDGVAASIVSILAEKKGISIDTSLTMSYEEYKETQYDLLAESLRESLDMDAIYQILEEGGKA